MAQLQKLPEPHTDFIVSVQWDWPLALLAIGVIALVIAAVVLYRRRPKKPD